MVTGCDDAVTADQFADTQRLALASGTSRTLGGSVRRFRDRMVFTMSQAS